MGEGGWIKRRGYLDEWIDRERIGRESEKEGKIEKKREG